MNRKSFAILAGIFTLLFLALTIVVLKVDIAVDPQTTKNIGLSTINLKMREIISIHPKLDKISTLVMAIGFACILVAFVMWLIQIFRFRSFTGVDCELYAYAAIAIVSGLCYIIFEKFIVNYRPILENGIAEASYPSSHILFIITLIGCAMMFVRARLRSVTMSKAITALFLLLMIIGVLCRMLSGKHWFTDCIASMLLGTALIFWYEAIAHTCKKRAGRELRSTDLEDREKPLREDVQSDYQRQVRDYGKDDNWRDSFTPPNQ